MKTFSKPFTQQEALPAAAVSRAVEVLETGRLHRYNTLPGEHGETALWEREYAAWQGSRFALATASGGAALQIALRAAGVEPGAAVLTNAFTLAPVPGAIAAVGAVPHFVETREDLTIDLADLDRAFDRTGAGVLLLSHMRGHLAPMEPLCAIVERHGGTLIEDCAHTMGARWNGVRSGNFGRLACFSTQTYKHLNSGEGGLLTSSDAELMARATILSGSYMLHDRHLAGPDEAAFERARWEMPNCSARMDNLRAAILRPQLPGLERNVERWNRRYRAVERGLDDVDGLVVPPRPPEERFVGSSIQFLVPPWPEAACRDFVRLCAERGVELKWFGAREPVGFTSRYDSWTYAPARTLPRTLSVLARLMDMRIPLSFTVADCETIAAIIADTFIQVQGRARERDQGRAPERDRLRDRSGPARPPAPE